MRANASAGCLQVASPVRSIRRNANVALKGAHRLRWCSLCSSVVFRPSSFLCASACFAANTRQAGLVTGSDEPVCNTTQCSHWRITHTASPMMMSFCKSGAVLRQIPRSQKSWSCSNSQHVFFTCCSKDQASSIKYACKVIDGCIDMELYYEAASSVKRGLPWLLFSAYHLQWSLSWLFDHPRPHRQTPQAQRCIDGPHAHCLQAVHADFQHQALPLQRAAAWFSPLLSRPPCRVQCGCVNVYTPCASASMRNNANM